MKRTLEISASFTGTIPTGQYENEKPFYSIKEILEYDNENTILNDNIINARQKELHDICYNQFKRQADIAYSEKIAKQYQNIRFYDGADGKKYPSSTSIIGMDSNFNIPPDELAQYGARGTCIHKQVELFLRSGEWKDAKDIPEISTEYMTVIQGNLGLSLDDTNFRAFFKDYPFQVLSLEGIVVNHDYRYGGRYDIACIIQSENKGKWEKIENVKYDTPTILDIKTSATLDKTYGLTQQASYAMTEEKYFKQIGLIHLTKENKSGFAKPVVTSNIPRYWDLFIKKRELFRERYGI